ncbi:hypothetical protein DWG18_13320 [Lysobacter sp. TY2-98]|uniref:hypothetical protein n=1 Tax=Lysobacter sp. TY2-98 TaxID=2290922 RepID=UPI000E1FD3F0|nr:hypothetical protein [Lysobacter sp. TY2-98]AXK73165.1 hypothetical protein DWG18_13320 [Lysobacter sp. TY2-98]
MRHAPLLLAATIVAATALPAWADQFEYLSLPQAQVALRHIRAGDVVHHFCAPCGDERSERMTVRQLGIDRVWDARGSSKVYRDGDRHGYWELLLNDVGVDLAYVYVRDGARWRNLADMLGLHPTNVPAVLPKASIGTRWRCGDVDENPYLTVLNEARDPCPIDEATGEPLRRTGE